MPSHIWVPIDDRHTLSFGVKRNPIAEWPDRTPSSSRELDATERMLPEQKGTYSAPWWPEINMSNDFAIDREAQKTTSFTGIPTIRLQDAAMTTSMGEISNRSRERLGTVDAMIIRTRQRFLRAAKALRDEGTPLPISDRPDLRVRSSSAILPEGVDWRTELEDWHLARTNLLLASQEATLVGAGSQRPGAPIPTTSDDHRGKPARCRPKPDPRLYRVLADALDVLIGARHLGFDQGLEAQQRWQGGSVIFGATNYSNYVNPEHDAMIERFFATIPNDERTRVAGDLLNHLSDQALYLGIYYIARPTVVRNGLSGTVGPDAGTIATYNVLQWNLR